MRLTVLNLLRLLWLSVPVTVGPAIEGALSGASGPITWVATIGLWAAWSAGLLALLVPRVLSLTVLRVGTPAVAVVAAAAAVHGDIEGPELVAVGVGAVGLVLAGWSTVGADLVDGSSYGPERRLPLRVPPAVALVTAPLAVAVVLAGLSIGPLLLAAGQWVLGGVVTAVGAALAVGAARALHALSRRFLVFVPGGVVVHDPMTLTDPVLLARGSLASVGPAPTDTDATDLTLGAGGLIMELRLQAAATLVLRRPGRGPDETVSTAAVLVCPTRSADFMAEAGSRRLPVARRSGGDGAA